jgi:hypothetical protein
VELDLCFSCPPLTTNRGSPRRPAVVSRYLASVFAQPYTKVAEMAKKMVAGTY